MLIVGELLVTGKTDRSRLPSCELLALSVTVRKIRIGGQSVTCLTIVIQ